MVSAEATPELFACGAMFHMGTEVFLRDDSTKGPVAQALVPDTINAVSTAVKSVTVSLDITSSRCAQDR